eukprot:g11437.t1 g11437   contig5:856889-858025(-)
MASSTTSICLIALCATLLMPTSVAFTSPFATLHYPSRVANLMIAKSSSIMMHRQSLSLRMGEPNGADYDFDPLLSPHAYPNGIDCGAVSGEAYGGGGLSSSVQSSSFGFFSFDDEEVAVTSSSVSYESTGAMDFDPLLSPHSYPNGVDAPPVMSITEAAAVEKYGGIENEPTEAVISAQSSIPAAVEADVDFDPLLSPHSYPNGVDAGPVLSSDEVAALGKSKQATTKQQKLGILLIDHGSKRQASNEHLHDIAVMYQQILDKKEVSNKRSDNLVVRGAHMEIAEPSILSTLRSLLVEDKATKIVCVPYFLSPGRHATVDVPNLINEAQGILDEEGLLGGSIGDEKVEVLVSDALGTHLERMLGAVDDLVEWTLKKER